MAGKMDVCGTNAQAVTVAPAGCHALGIAPTVIVGMFLIGLIGGCKSSSVALQADALDFPEDIANNAIALIAADDGLPLLAVAACFTSVGTFLGFPVVLLIVDHSAIVREAQYLNRRFRAPCNDYKQKVQRWL